MNNQPKKWNYIPDEEYPDDPNSTNDGPVGDAQSRKILLYNNDNGNIFSMVPTIY